MAVEVVSGTPLAEALQAAVQPKLVDIGWSTGALDDSALSEYIILMLVNAKTQDQIASELQHDLLSLNPDDTSAVEFSRWLFELLNELTNGGAAAQPQQSNGVVEQMDQSQGEATATDSTVQDAAMSDGDGVIGGTALVTPADRQIVEHELTHDRPTGPKAMRNGSAGPGRTRDRRMLGQIGKAMDRTGDASLHRIKGAAGGRINQHSRDPPRGPKNMANRMQNMMAGGRPGAMGMNPQMTQNAMLGSTPQQQMQLLQLLEEQSRMMAQILGPQGQAMGNAPAINPAFFGQNGGPQAGKSLFERVDKRSKQNGHFKSKPRTGRADEDTEMDTAAEGDAEGKKDLASTPCRFQLSCTSATCPYAHQSPAAPPGTSIDVTDKCSFGAACTNKKCAGTHPSPATKRQHLGSSVDCKFYPNCTNASCPFRHPTTPPCRNGADCPTKDSGCKFSHSSISCRYNPCLNPSCPFVHAEGQKRGKFEDKVWTAEGFDREAAEMKDAEGGKFEIGEGEEELILPGRMEEGAPEPSALINDQSSSSQLAEIVT